MPTPEEILARSFPKMFAAGKISAAPPLDDKGVAKTINREKAAHIQRQQEIISIKAPTPTMLRLLAIQYLKLPSRIGGFSAYCRNHNIHPRELSLELSRLRGNIFSE